MKKTDSDKLNELKEIAQKRNATLLSKEWLGYREEHEFVDNNGIYFTVSKRNINRGIWLPNRGLVVEPIIKQLFEHLFQTTFNKNRKILDKKFIKKNRNWELDGFSDKFQIAFEYQGHPSHWDKDNIRFNETSERDKLKKYFCEKLNILLLQIPPIKTQHINEENIIKHVISFIENNHHHLLKSFVNKPESFKINFSVISNEIEKMNTIKEIAERNNGKLLSTEWVGDKKTYQFEHESGTIFEITAFNLRNNGWPKDINQFIVKRNNFKKTKEELLNEIKEIAERNNGRLLSTEWIGINAKYQFEHESGTIFEREAKTLKNLGWPKNFEKFLKMSAYFKKTNEQLLNELKEIAEKNNGKLLSTEWVGDKEIYQFEHESGAIFEREAKTLKNLGWPKQIKNKFKM